MASGRIGNSLRPGSNAPAADSAHIAANHATSGTATASHVVTRLAARGFARVSAAQRPNRIAVTTAGSTISTTIR